MKYGLLVVGIYGASASTLVKQTLSSSKDESYKSGSYWCSLLGDYPPEIYQIVVGGWDYAHETFDAAVRANGIVGFDTALGSNEPTIFPAVIGPSDYAFRVDGREISHTSEQDAIAEVRANIASFRETHHLDRVLVVNASSPMYCGPNDSAGWSSIFAYARASISEGADWVEFTPSDSITDDLIADCQKTGSHIAGRDGSTGQTILKLALRDFLDVRGLRIESWYSTNLIGNRDGLVLSHDDYNVTKLRDKKSVLSQAGINSHVVNIEYIPPAGDNKESWDCIFFSGWLDAKMSLRINWHGADSFLAAPLILDIISGLIRAHQTGFPPGVVEPLSLFFKAPVGKTEYLFDELYADFKAFAATSSI